MQSQSPQHLRARSEPHRTQASILFCQLYTLQMMEAEKQPCKKQRSLKDFISRSSNSSTRSSQASTYVGALGTFFSAQPLDGRSGDSASDFNEVCVLEDSRVSTEGCKVVEGSLVCSI